MEQKGSMSEIVIRISLPEGVTPVVDYQDEPPPPWEKAATAPQSHAAPSCPVHGPMTHKSGVSKAGNAYSGWFCAVDGCDKKQWDPK